LQQAQALEGIAAAKQEAVLAAQMGSFNPLTVGALLKMNSGGSVAQTASDGNASLVGGQVVSSSLSAAQAQSMVVAALSGTPSPSPPSSSSNNAAAPIISHHLQQAEGTVKFGSPSPHHSPNPNTPHHHAQVVPSAATGAKRPAPIQIPPAVNRIVDETGAGSGAPTTPASPFTGQQGRRSYNDIITMVRGIDFGGKNIGFESDQKWMEV
jgi:hypothetical protein